MRRTPSVPAGSPAGRSTPRSPGPAGRSVGALARVLGGRADGAGREALRGLERGGWQVRSAVPFAHGDVDHVAVGGDRVLVVHREVPAGPDAADPVVLARRSLQRTTELLAGSTGGAGAGAPDGLAVLVRPTGGRGRAPQGPAGLVTERAGVIVVDLAGLRRLVAELGPCRDRERALAQGEALDRHEHRRRSYQRARSPA